MRTFCDIRIETVNGYQISRTGQDGSLIITVRGGEPLSVRQETLLLEAIGRHLEAVGTGDASAMATEELHERLNRRFEGADLSVRALNAIEDAVNGHHVGNLVQVTESLLLKQKNCGIHTVKEIRDFLTGMQLRLGMTKDQLRGWQAPQSASP